MSNTNLAALMATVPPWGVTPIKDDPELTAMLIRAREAWDAMTAEQRAEEMRLQRESWSRQDLD